jgi:putative alpha-1,2-mannosidase
MSVFELVPEAGEDDLPASLLTPWWTAVYHTLMGVSTYSEVGGDYIGFDGGAGSGFGELKTLEPTDPPFVDRQLSDMSLWDTHRSWNPLMVLVQPDIATAVARSLVRMTKEGGTVPRQVHKQSISACGRLVDVDRLCVIAAGLSPTGLPAA